MANVPLEGQTLWTCVCHGLVHKILLGRIQGGGNNRFRGLPIPTNNSGLITINCLKRINKRGTASIKNTPPFLKLVRGVFCPLFADDLVDQAVVFGFLCGHEIVAVRVLFNHLEVLAGVV